MGGFFLCGVRSFPVRRNVIPSLPRDLMGGFFLREVRSFPVCRNVIPSLPRDLMGGFFLCGTTLAPWRGGTTITARPLPNRRDARPNGPTFKSKGRSPCEMSPNVHAPQRGVIPSVVKMADAQSNLAPNGADTPSRFLVRLGTTSLPWCGGTTFTARPLFNRQAPAANVHPASRSVRAQIGYLA